MNQGRISELRTDVFVALQDSYDSRGLASRERKQLKKSVIDAAYELLNCAGRTSKEPCCFGNDRPARKKRAWQVAKGFDAGGMVLVFA